LQRDARGHFVAVAVDSSRERRNFSILHEVGHYLIGKGAAGLGGLTPQQVNAIKVGYQEEEDLCNRIAAELLMPEVEFRKQMLEAGVPPTWQALRGLAGLFVASVEATVRRFGEFYEGTLLVERWSGGNKGRLERSVLAVSKDLKWFTAREGPLPMSAPNFVVDFLGCDSDQPCQVIQRQLPVRGRVRAMRVELWKRRYLDASQVLLLATPVESGEADDHPASRRRDRAVDHRGFKEQ
jgi:hypothetical protein